MQSGLKRTRVARLAVGAAAVMALAAGIGSVVADIPKDGRYTMKEADGGFVRLDTLTGAMSTCTRTDDKWACTPMHDSLKQLNEELDKLRIDNAKLKDEIRQMEEVFGLKDSQRNDGGQGEQSPTKPKLSLPSEEDIDQAVDYLERMIRKFRERFEDFGDKTRPPPRHSRPDDRDSRPL